MRLLTSGNDVHTPVSAASIIPLATLNANTSYDVSFIGKVNGADVTHSWSFTTR
ncbi:hypothetical protein D3C81_1983060 [compost metagenome]